MKKTNNESGDTSIETCQSETQREKIITKIISRELSGYEVFTTDATYM